MSAQESDDERGRRLHLHLLEQPAAVDLDGPATDTERGGDLLGPLPRQQELGHLLLAWRETRGALLDQPLRCIRFLPLTPEFECVADVYQELAGR